MLRRYGRTKLGNILFAREITRRHLTDVDKPILAISVHPGTVDTDAQSAWGESYGVFGKILGQGSKLFGKTASEGAEAGLWAATSADIFEGNWKDFQVSHLLDGGYQWPCSSFIVRAITILSPMESRIQRPTRRRAKSSVPTSGTFVRGSARSSLEKPSGEVRYIQIANNCNGVECVK